MSMDAKGIIGGGNKERRKASDLYPTPREVTIAILDLISPYLPSGGVIWEPACGEMDMADVIREKGYTVIATDILTGTDYLTAPVPDGASWAITNPPFFLAEDFIRKAKSDGLPFAMLLKSQFYSGPPDIVAPLTWRPDFNFKSEGRHGSPLMEVMWCVWLPLIQRSGVTKYIPIAKPKN